MRKGVIAGFILCSLASLDVLTGELIGHHKKVRATSYETDCPKELSRAGFRTSGRFSIVKRLCWKSNS